MLLERRRPKNLKAEVFCKTIIQFTQLKDIEMENLKKVSGLITPPLLQAYFWLFPCRK